MRLAIVLLSDIHFKSRSDVAFKRLDKLANTISFAKGPGEQLLFLVLGDIANTGNSIEYEVAKDFFTGLLAKSAVGAADTPLALTFIPGNHDCNFSGAGDLRPALLENLQTQLDSLDANGERVRTLLSTQSDFYSFNNLMTGETLGPRDQLYRVRKIRVGSEMLELRCFNSAWLSSRHEEPGSLGFPGSIVRAAGEHTDATVVISLVHHPYNWLSPAAYQSFRKAIQESSDFLITGHEHIQGGNAIISFSGSQLIHFESGPLQCPSSGESDFGVLHLDLHARSWNHDTYRWLSGAYIKSSGGKTSILPIKSERSVNLQLTPSFLARLRDPGTGFLHPRQSELSLSDIYVYPNLKTRVASRKLRNAADLPKEIPSREVVARVLGTDRIVIAGPSDCGKTALSKMLFLDANTKKGKTTLLLCGKSFRGQNPDKAYKAAVDAAIDDAYGPGHSGHFASLDKNKRLLIIDDWDEASFNRVGRAVILQNAMEHFGSVIVLVDDIFLIEELSSRQEITPLIDFEILDIKEFGFHLRGELITQWHALGRTYTEDEHQFARAIADSTRVIDTVLGRNLLPSFPLYVLTLLQTYDAGAGSQSSGLGSYGQVYEALITARLARVSIKSVDIGTKITLLSRVAWLLFSLRKRYLSLSEWRTVIDVYYSEYKIRIDGEALRQSLLSASILLEDESGLRFTYGYSFCYFVAKYFQENLADLDDDTGRPALYQSLKELSEQVYRQDNASIIIFYVFLTKDRTLIFHVIGNAKLIFKDAPEFDFAEQVKFVNQIISPISVVQLSAGIPEVNRREYDQRRDEAGEQIEPQGDPNITDVSYRSDMPYEQKLIIGIRYLTLMGQILRNFPGSLKAETKLELAFESYSLGLRVLGSVFELAQSDSEGLITEVSEVLRNKMAFSGSERQLRDRAELIIADMLREIAFALLKRMSHAIGLKELEATYDEVSMLRDDSLATRLIQLSIRLDHFEKFPRQDIEELAEELKSNTFSYQTLRDLVINHLYLFPTDYGTQQWAGSVLKVKVNQPQIRGTSRKLLQH